MKSNLISVLDNIKYGKIYGTFYEKDKKELIDNLISLDEIGILDNTIRALVVIYREYYKTYGYNDKKQDDVFVSVLKIISRYNVVSIIDIILKYFKFWENKSDSTFNYRYWTDIKAKIQRNDLPRYPY